MNRNTLLILFILALSAGGVLYFSKSFVTPYVTLQEAKRTDAVVQVVADRIPGIAPLPTSAGILLKVKDLKGEEFTALCADIHDPARILQAERIVLIGTYNSGEGIFTATKVLTKCPSKYKKK